MSYNVPVRLLQGGSVEQTAASGTQLISSGGSIQVAAGGNIYVTDAAGITFQAGLSLGGTVGRWAFGTAGFSGGVGTVATGLTRVISVNIQPVSADAPGLGSFVTSVVDLSLAGAGSFIMRAGAGTLPYANGGTYAWQAFGT
jgi:hypothetical protein